LILALIRENPSITRIELAEKLNINESAVQKHILMMKKMSLIERKGGKKYGQWIILANTDTEKGSASDKI
jgi:ATP-dependent DNA helicase RecG